MGFCAFMAVLNLGLGFFIKEEKVFPWYIVVGTIWAAACVIIAELKP